MPVCPALFDGRFISGESGRPGLPGRLTIVRRETFGVGPKQIDWRFRPTPYCSAGRLVINLPTKLNRGVMTEKPQILVVEDDALVSDIIAAALDGTYPTKSVESAKEAIGLLREGGFRLMLLDCTCPAASMSI